jgi:hypothetical protein
MKGTECDFYSFDEEDKQLKKIEKEISYFIYYKNLLLVDQVLNLTCARRRQLGWFVSELPWGLEPHDIPIGEQWGGRCAGLPHLLVAMIGSSSRGTPVGREPGPAVVQVTRRPCWAIKYEASREKGLSCGSTQA